MRNKLIELSVKNVLGNIGSEDTPNRLLNNGKHIVYSPINVYNGCGLSSGNKQYKSNSCCSAEDHCIEYSSSNPSDLCYARNDCQTKFGICILKDHIITNNTDPTTTLDKPSTTTVVIPSTTQKNCHTPLIFYDNNKTNVYYEEQYFEYIDHIEDSSPLTHPKYDCVLADADIYDDGLQIDGIAYCGKVYYKDDAIRFRIETNPEKTIHFTNNTVVLEKVYHAHFDSYNGDKFAVNPEVLDNQIHVQYRSYKNELILLEKDNIKSNFNRPIDSNEENNFANLLRLYNNNVNIRLYNLNKYRNGSISSIEEFKNQVTYKHSLTPIYSIEELESFCINSEHLFKLNLFFKSSVDTTPSTTTTTTRKAEVTTTTTKRKTVTTTTTTTTKTTTTERKTVTTTTTPTTTIPTTTKKAAETSSDNHLYTVKLKGTLEFSKYYLGVDQLTPQAYFFIYQEEKDGVSAPYRTWHITSKNEPSYLYLSEAKYGNNGEPSELCLDVNSSSSSSYYYNTLSIVKCTEAKHKFLYGGTYSNVIDIYNQNNEHYLDLLGNPLCIYYSDIPYAAKCSNIEKTSDELAQHMKWTIHYL